NPQRPAQPAAAPGRQHPPVPGTATRLTSPNAFGNGKGGAFQGLAYVIPDTTKKIPASVLVPFAALYTDRFDIQPQEFSSGFPGAMMQNDWFLIRYEGAFNVPSQGKWQFRVISDDGAKLYVDDKLVVDNDGLHTAKQADGELTLTPGRHWLRLDYFQGPRGPVALSVLTGQNGKLSPLTGVR
ncbi:MAG TPA: PA14 domain-containing protein, partial [Candidatus Nanopelagicales bacterium]|nr:PA14 domain-containing protein [Candidatus Nanopelagicales bacterium]